MNTLSLILILLSLSSLHPTLFDLSHWMVVWMSSESYSSSFVLLSFCLSVSIPMLYLSKVPIDGAHVTDIWYISKCVTLQMGILLCSDTSKNVMKNYFTIFCKKMSIFVNISSNFLHAIFIPQATFGTKTPSDSTTNTAKKHPSFIKGEKILFRKLLYDCIVFFLVALFSTSIIIWIFQAVIIIKN